jgi:hypothetical protein
MRLRQGYSHRLPEGIIPQERLVTFLPEYKFALMTHLHTGYKELRELPVKTDLNASRNQKLKSSVTRNQFPSKPSIQYREK